jgi:hypothetical protein
MAMAPERPGFPLTHESLDREEARLLAEFRGWTAAGCVNLARFLNDFERPPRTISAAKAERAERARRDRRAAANIIENTLRVIASELADIDRWRRELLAQEAAEDPAP